MQTIPVDVILPVFNDQDGVDRALMSIGKQTVRPARVIIVDDASSDATFIPPQAFDIPITLKRLDTNSGPSFARNTAIGLADSDYVALLDSDDAWFPQKLEKQFAFIKAQEKLNDGPIATVSGFHIEGGYGLGSKTGGKSLVPIGASKISDFAGGCWHCPGSTLMMKRQILIDCGLYDETLKRLEDYDFFLRFANYGGKLLVLPEILSMIFVKRDDRRELPLESIDQLLERYTGKNSPIEVKAQSKVKAYLYLEIAAQSYRRGALLAAIRYTLKSVWAYPRLSAYVENFWMTKNVELEDI